MSDWAKNLNKFLGVLPPGTTMDILEPSNKFMKVFTAAWHIPSKESYISVLFIMLIIPFNQ